MTNDHTPNWDEVREVVNRGLRSTLHSSIATINDDGSPHVTPIGSLFLDPDYSGRYLELFATGLGHNLDRDPRFTILVVDSSPNLWLSSLESGLFTQSPGVRLVGTAGQRRQPEQNEADEMLAFAEGLKGLKGYDLLWGSGGWVRDLTIERVLPIRIGPMTPQFHASIAR